MAFLESLGVYGLTCDAVFKQKCYQRYVPVRSDLLLRNSGRICHKNLSVSCGIVFTYQERVIEVQCYYFLEHLGLQLRAQ